MNQHSIQEAYYKPFRDRGMVWVYEKDATAKFRRPISWVTADQDFQSDALEQAQNRLIESPGIRTVRRLLRPGRLADKEYLLVTKWLALHLTRSQKMRRALYPSPPEFEREFFREFSTQLFAIHACYKVADVYTPDAPCFFVTSDNPILEFEAAGVNTLLLPLSPSKVLQLAGQDGRWQHESEPFEFVLNAMIWASAHKYIISNRDDLNLQSLRDAAAKWHLEPTLETQSFRIGQTSSTAAPIAGSSSLN